MKNIKENRDILKKFGFKESKNGWWNYGCFSVYLETLKSFSDLSNKMLSDQNYYKCELLKFKDKMWKHADKVIKTWFK